MPTKDGNRLPGGKKPREPYSAPHRAERAGPYFALGREENRLRQRRFRDAASGLSGRQKSISPAPGPGIVGVAFFSGFSAIIASVVTSNPATEEAS